VRISRGFRTFMDVFAITGLWVGVLFMVSLGLMDAGSDRAFEIGWGLVAFGFLIHVVGYFLLNARRARPS
jgi:hypothetical protein